MPAFRLSVVEPRALTAMLLPQALQSQVAGFDADVMDSCPHKHDVLVASELSALLVRPPD